MVDERAPDHSRLTKLKDWLIDRGKSEDRQGVYDRMSRQAIGHRIGTRRCR